MHLDLPVCNVRLHEIVIMIVTHLALHSEVLLDCSYGVYLLMVTQERMLGSLLQKVAS